MEPQCSISQDQSRSVSPELSVKFLPQGIQSFSTIITEGKHYVDKTQLIYQLVTNYTGCFLSRPRRFGKTLTLNTIHCLFQGRRDLFDGLLVQKHGHWNWDVKFPIIRLNLARGGYSTFIRFENSIRSQLRQSRSDLCLKPVCDTSASIDDLFLQLLDDVYSKYQQPLVVLIDEYDSPILNNLNNSELAEQILRELRDFYGCLKNCSVPLRFVFLTGITQFDKSDMFSGLNQLVDISLHPSYATLCGFTENEVKTVFQAFLSGLNFEEIKKWYNGYRWGDERVSAVYNPFSLLQYFDQRAYRPYWYETGQPSFLVTLITTRGVSFASLATQCNSSELTSLKLSKMSIPALMYQCGYLTITKVDHSHEKPIYYLDYPNLEVRSCLHEEILRDFYMSPCGSNVLLNHLETTNFNEMLEHFKSLFASIPHQWFSNNRIADFEAFYSSVFFSHFAACPVTVIGEDTTNHGRIDMTVLYKDLCFIFQFKVVECAPSGNALSQIKHKKYAEKYLSSYKRIHLIGVEFSKKERQIVTFDVESLPVFK
ncbi:hypothetical protein RCL1_006935 [Eukaryota sp. TZLM3-RCL]